MTAQPESPSSSQHSDASPATLEPIALLQSPILGAVPGIVHGFTTRFGGTSTGPFATLNLATTVEDDRNVVAQNRQRVLQTLGCPESTWVSLHQVHGSDVVQVMRAAGRNIDADGVWTLDKSVAVAVLVADCVPILLADEKGQAVAAVHAGWRGTQSKIVALMVERLRSAGIATSRLRAAIGPAIGPCCFEIGADVEDSLRLAYPDAGDAIIRTSAEKAVADLWTLNQRALIAAGLDAAHIDVVRTCTSCSSTLFSHRRDGGRTGRQAGVIGFAPIVAHSAHT